MLCILLITECICIMLHLKEIVGQSTPHHRDLSDDGTDDALCTQFADVGSDVTRQGRERRKRCKEYVRGIVR